jgi:TctA family transporter
VRPQAAQILTRIHSHRWRARYGDEFEALLLELPCTPHVVWNSLESAWASQRGLALALCAGAITAALLLFTSGPHHRHTVVAVHVPVKQHLCDNYASTSQNEWAQRKECLV